MRQQDLANYLEKYLNYYLIKGTPTAHWGAFSRIQINQSMFVWIMLMKYYQTNTFYWWIKLFNKNIKTEYNWVTKGIISTIINQKHSGSKSMILAFCTDGDISLQLLIGLLIQKYLNISYVYLNIYKLKDSNLLNRLLFYYN